MKVLFLGPYRDGTGWAEAAQHYILSMDHVGIDVVPRFVKLNNIDGFVPDRLAELERKSKIGLKFTHLIQENLPQYMKYDGYFGDNIALIFAETENFIQSTWSNRLSVMDRIWCPSRFIQDACNSSGVTCPKSVIPVPVNLSKYSQQYPSYELGIPKGVFTFYTIMEFSRRKNLAALIRAFHGEFYRNEPVCLVIKTGIYGKNQEKKKKIIQEYINTIKKETKLYGDYYNDKEVIITEYLNQDELMGLHKSCDCFVSTSNGEGWCLPCIDAMGMMNPVIVPNYGGFKDYCDEDNSLLINVYEEPAFGASDTFADLYTSRQNWGIPSINSLKRHMRSIYESSNLREKLVDSALDSLEQFSYDKVGQLILNELSGQATTSSTVSTNFTGSEALSSVDKG